MRTKVDLLPLSLHLLKVSAFHRVWIKLGMGFHCRARATDQGYDVRLRYGKNDETKQLPVRVEFGTKRADGVPRPTLVCTACGKFTTKYLYLDTTKWRWSCAACLGVKPWQIRIPMRWDLGEETKFRRLLRRKIDEDILKFELAALKTLSPEEFFTSRPYLLPEWLDRVKALDANLHLKILKTLHGKYKSVMMKRNVKILSEVEEKWLMEKLTFVVSSASIITRREVAWLKQQQQSQKQSTICLQQERESTELVLPGNQPGSRSAASGSQPLEIGCSSVKTSSGLAMNAGAAEVEAKSLAQIVKELELSEQSSSVPHVKGQDE
jgi:hypothetical protein